MSYATVLELATMSRNVYYNLNSSDWLNGTYTNVWDVSVSNDTVRAYLFTGSDIGNVVAFKGTSTYWTTVQIRDPSLCYRKNAFVDDVSVMSTVQNDKYNDNLYYTCCFYKQSTLFGCNDTSVRLNDTYTDHSKKTCNTSCYARSKGDPLNYMNVITDVIRNVYDIIDPNEQLMFTGHSLGGTLASLAAVIYNMTAVSFESPGDRHYAEIIGLDTHRGRVYQFGHNGDPLFRGHCGQLCNLLGYHVNTKCHIGTTCLYDSQSKLGLSESILNHRIDYIVRDIIPEWKTDFPICTQDDQCEDCTSWTFI